MKAIRLFILTLLVLCAVKSYSQVEQSKVYFMRPSNYKGTLLHFNLYIDDQLVCKIKNGRYSEHAIPVGQHTFSVQNTGLGNHDKSRALKIDAVKGKPIYINIVNGKQLYLEELTPNSGEISLKKLLLMTDCFPKTKEK